MAVLTECSGVNIACFYPSALTMLCPITVRRLHRPVPSAVLTEQRCHILEVGLASIVSVLWKHHHICVLVGEELPAAAQELKRVGNCLNHPTRMEIGFSLWATLQSCTPISMRVGAPIRQGEAQLNKSSHGAKPLHQHLYPTSISFCAAHDISHSMNSDPSSIENLCDCNPN